MDNFLELKEICRLACHERNACRNGFDALMRADSIPQIMQVWKDNWDDIFRSRYADIMVKKLTEVDKSMIAEFRKGGVYVNEDSTDGYVIISNPARPINVGGNARAYIFTAAEVNATDNAQVYCRTAGAKITLRGHSYCHCDNSDTIVEVYNFAKADGQMQCHTHHAAQVNISYGTLTDYGHRRITASGGAVVYSNATKGIELSGEAIQHTLEDVRGKM